MLQDAILLTSNMLNAIDDVLVKFGTLTDDNRNIIYKHDGSMILYDKDNPRAEITITPIKEGEFEEWSVRSSRKKSAD